MPKPGEPARPATWIGDNNVVRLEKRLPPPPPPPPPSIFTPTGRAPLRREIPGPQTKSQVENREEYLDKFWLQGAEIPNSPMHTCGKRGGEAGRGPPPRRVGTPTVAQPTHPGGRQYSYFQWSGTCVQVLGTYPKWTTWIVTNRGPL